MKEPLAFFLTFRTYGTWLHGDGRGSVDNAHNVFGTPLLDPDAPRMRRAAAAMKYAPLIFDDAMRGCVDESVVDTCRFREWVLVERAVRTNHVHAVVGYHGIAPEEMLQKLKARATRALRERRMVAPARPVWGDGPGSRRYLWTERDIADAACYVRDYQDQPR